MRPRVGYEIVSNSMRQGPVFSAILNIATALNTGLWGLQYYYYCDTGLLLQQDKSALAAPTVLYYQGPVFSAILHIALLPSLVCDGQQLRTVYTGTPARHVLEISAAHIPN